MPWRRPALVALALAGCGRRAPPAPRDGGPPGTEIGIHAAIDDRAMAPITVGEAPIDLWTLCERGDVASIEARAGNGAFVHGDCAHRDHYSFRLVRRGAQVAAELQSARRFAGGSPLHGCDLLAALSNRPTPSSRLPHPRTHGAPRLAGSHSLARAYGRALAPTHAA